MGHIRGHIRGHIGDTPYLTVTVVSLVDADLTHPFHFTECTSCDSSIPRIHASFETMAAKSASIDFNPFGFPSLHYYLTHTVVSVVDTDLITPNHEFDETDSLEIVTVLFDGTETRHPDR